MHILSVKRLTIIDTKNAETQSTISFSLHPTLRNGRDDCLHSFHTTTAASLSQQLRVIPNVSQCELCPALDHPGATSRPLAPRPRM
ncbi:hypothetical protein CEXT_171901 [Caerostris extrusa]|uniref:Uncharacterized protein n=1 Tax=Caerostris extrusa TaxID=172846 RepID=A0AAV4V4N7_CAEEX|nr:hypothetical protein CEXT_171901 [Caerostris extrusa]